MKKTKQLNATALRAILTSTLVLIVAAGAAIFIYANKQLGAVAVEVSHATVDAASSDNNLSNLQMVERELVKQRDAIARTSSIVADSQSYQYQDQIIDDLNEYARRAKISITNLDFGASPDGTAAPSATPAPAPAGGTAGTPPATPTAVGVKSTTVSVTLANPVNYNDLLTFVRLIEQNLTKMQISKLSLSADQSTGGVTSDSLTIEVYIK